ncbi:TolC family protein [Zeaxanthinibacter sp. PT1]|uniref:TolC family protein n=1 Tax=Zeaxanthinibacter TaxID=561554 RepID=UPI00234B3014|nr:TolC family protein [Zeaxanthinibacter sp. PT1]MDC6350169.1 TolC family protein [Zeaxanthinibacter sp. PT1]
MRNPLLTFLLILVCFNVKAQDLQTYIGIAVAENPGLKAYETRYKIAQEKVEEANWIPNTELSTSYFMSEPETRTGPQRARFAARQMFPWFGTINSREKYATVLSEAEYTDYQVERRELILKVARSFYQLQALKAQDAILQENIDLLETYERLAITSVEVGSASAADVLRLQIRQNELRQESRTIQQEILAETAGFDALLNRKGETTYNFPDSLGIPSHDPEISNEGLLLNPELVRFDKLYKSVIRAEALNRKEAAPMFGFGVDYIPVANRTDMSVPENGKDILMPMVSLSIPIFNKQFRSRTVQNEMRQTELELQRQERLNQLQSALARAIHERNAARVTHGLLEENLHQVRQVEDILLKNYETGTIDFNEILDIQEMHLRFQNKLTEAVRTYYEKSAIINYLTQ